MAIEFKPYIGITGITLPDEANFIKEIFSETAPKLDTHNFMAGYLVSLGSIRSPHRINRYVDPSQLTELLEITQGNRIINTLHVRTSRKQHLAADVISLFTDSNIYNQGLCRAVQLNMTWPQTTQIEEIKNTLPDLSIILQIGQTALKKTAVATLPFILDQYTGLVDFVLIDPSGGAGRAFRLPEIASTYDTIVHSLPNATIVLAGGFSNMNIQSRLEEIQASLGTKNFGIDAENNLRTKNLLRDHLSKQSCQEYVYKSVGFFKD